MSKRASNRRKRQERTARQEGFSSTTRGVDSGEFQFDLVDSEEWVDCANWEFHRELCRRDGEPVPDPWLVMTPKERRSVRVVTLPGLFEDCPAIELPPPILHGAKCSTVNGQAVASAEVVELEVLIRWDQSDGRILKGMERVFKGWLRGQRHSNPNAKAFNPGRPLRGKKPEPITFLTRLAVWRLSTRANLSAAAIEDLIRPLLKRAGQSGLSGNLARWCNTIDQLLRK